jgi:two-component system, NtrC family, nitrogen regulation sensor histidine kinase NtrY
VSFRTKLLLVSSLSVAGAVALVTGAVSLLARRSFERIDEDRRQGLLQQFQRELDSQGREVEAAVQRVAWSEALLRIAVEANRREPDFAAYVSEAGAQAGSQALDFLDIVQQDSTIVSSAHTPARFAYKNDWLLAEPDWSGGSAFLTRVPYSDGTAIALVALRVVSAGEKKIAVIGGRKLDPSFLGTLEVAPGMRAMLWLSTGELVDAKGPVPSPEKLSEVVGRVKRTGAQASGTVQWTPNRASSESVIALPLAHGGQLLGALLVGASLREQIWLEHRILWTGVGVGGFGALLGALLGWWTTARVTRPISQLVSGVRSVGGGDWSARVPVSSADEIGELAQAFNHMTEQLLEQRDRTVQAERVAAWRELARRLAHELKNPLFPLLITVENLQKARDQHPEQFDEVFRESTATLLAELQNLRQIIGQFSDFAKMPRPELEPVNANSLVEDVVRLFEAQFRAEGRPPIEPVLELSDGDVTVPADPLQLRRALCNLVLNAMDAMPDGGTLRLRTDRVGDHVRIEVSDSGQGLTEEECARLFTPYYTTKRHGTGLGLAIVQSVVADHHGKMAVAAQPGRGATFTIDLPLGRES